MKIKRKALNGTGPIQPPRSRMAKHILCVDPGTTESAFMEFFPHSRRIGRFGKVKNAQLLATLLTVRPQLVVCEEIRSYGRPVGQTTFDTVRFTGRVQQLCFTENIPFESLPRFKVKSALKPLPRRNDKDVRASLIKLYGESGTKNNPGPTYGITKDVWAALGVAHAYHVYNK